MTRQILAGIEILILTALILAPRCANYEDVFVGGNIYFTDADCYARMTRVRICQQHPGTILRHHDFENFPQGTTPHTTAPFDYLVLALSASLKPFVDQSADFAGALISPILALSGGWFLWWWSRRMKFRYRWIGLVLYAISPILVHGTELGRPDHQSLLILLVTIGVCAEWTLRKAESRNWSIVSGAAWALALWVSLYEPLILFGAILFAGLTIERGALFNTQRRLGWIAFAVLIALAVLIERRVPVALSILQSGRAFENWSRTIGELAPVPALNYIWFVWTGYLLAVAPILIWMSWRKSNAQMLPRFVLVLLVTTFLLTIWQARWGYFFLLVFAVSLPTLLEPINSRVAVWLAFGLSVFPVLQFWDGRLWPNESELAARIERRNEARDLRDLATMMRSKAVRPFLAPWWQSPAISYWSGQPGVGGSSHEALAGTLETARFFLVDDPQQGRQLLRARNVEWVVAYDWERVRQNSTSLLETTASDGAIGRNLDRTPASAPAYLVLSGQNRTAKLFRFVDKL